MPFATQLLNEISAALPELAPGHEPMSAVWGQGDQTTDDEIFFVRKSDARRHLVHLQVGRTFVEVNVSNFVEEDLGDGIVCVSFQSLNHGSPRRPVEIDRIKEDLRKAFAEQKNAFEPAKSPGVATHPNFPDTLSAVRAALQTLDGDGDAFQIRVNGDGAGYGEDDVITFSAADGTEHPLALRTAPGEALVFERESGRTVLKGSRYHGFDKLAPLLAETLARHGDQARLAPGLH